MLLLIVLMSILHCFRGTRALQLFQVTACYFKKSFASDATVQTTCQTYRLIGRYRRSKDRKSMLVADAPLRQLTPNLDFLCTNNSQFATGNKHTANLSHSKMPVVSDVLHAGSGRDADALISCAAQVLALQ